MSSYPLPQKGKNSPNPNFSEKSCIESFNSNRYVLILIHFLYKLKELFLRSSTWLNFIYSCRVNIMYTGGPNQIYWCAIWSKKKNLIWWFCDVICFDLETTVSKGYQGHKQFTSNSWRTTFLRYFLSWIKTGSFWC